MVILWGTYFDPEDAAKLRIRVDARRVSVTDMFGNNTKNVVHGNGMSIEVSANPVYLVGKNTSTQELKATLLQGAWDEF